tara:strand:- start:71 stop:340 length:270 start_codon:yes stop_codon:yes gene_type:complete
VTRFQLEIRVVPRPGLLDPEGKAIQSGLLSLDYPDVQEVRVGKLLLIELVADSPKGAMDMATSMCERLLANPVTEDFQIQILEENENSE